MDSRAKIYELSNQLTYTQYNVNGFGETVAETIKELSTLLENEEDKAYKDIYKQLGIYYAFYARNRELAYKYFQKFQACCVTETEITEALHFIAYSKVMDPTYHDIKIFDEILDRIPNDTRDISALAIKAMAIQYYAMMLHRQGMRNKSIDELKLELALEKIQEAVAIHRSLLIEFPLIKIFLAESLHLYGAMLSRSGEMINKDHFLIADTVFTEAAKLENEVCVETNAPHFLTAITMQSHAIVQRHLNKHDESMKLLQAALQEQITMFKTEVHREIGKSWHFIGDAHHARKNYPDAVEAYLKALVCKMQIKYDDDYMVKTSQNALLISLGFIPEVIAAELRNTICLALTDETKLFVNKCQDFIQTIQFKTMAATIINTLSGKSPIKNMKEIEGTFSSILTEAFNNNSFTCDEYLSLSQNMQSIFINTMANRFNTHYANQLLDNVTTRRHDIQNGYLQYFKDLYLLKDAEHSDIKNIITDFVMEFVDYTTTRRNQIRTIQAGIHYNESFFSYLDKPLLDNIFDKLLDKDIVQREQSSLRK